MLKLMLIGTAHVIDLSLPLERSIRNFDPELVALELDKQRWYALKSESNKLQGPFYLRILARFQRYLGDTFGSSPGAEMVVATNVANSLNSKLAFIDKPILHTIRGAWKRMPWNEFFKMIMDGLVSFVGGGDVNVERSMRTGDFTNELVQFANEYPSLKSELIDKRDHYMAMNIIKLFRTQKCQRIVAIVGEGHIEGMAKKLNGLNPSIVRLKDLLSDRGNSISFSIEI
ncbi:MAG: hypothetical protein CMB06_00280 [Euryarchaeota archaeon]|nr:hypothetical protein [Euryarchaeota archaeon]|tara:strand:- start:2700 stop:3386 length:687 start_codon:yes stop_codon:yes gene_type:complete